MGNNNHFQSRGKFPRLFTPGETLLLQISDPLLGDAHTSAVEVPAREEIPPFKVLLSLSCRDCIALELPELVAWPHPKKTEKRHVPDVLEE